jgi:hypothetical protein
MNVDFNRLTKKDLVHLLHDVVGTTKVLNHFKECWEFQLEDQKKNGGCPCYECRDIGKKLNLI